MVGDAGEAGPFEAVLAGLAYGVASALVFVVGGDVAECPESQILAQV